MSENMENMKNAAGVKVIEREGLWYIQARDNVFAVDSERQLPANFKELDNDKQRYWLNRRITECAKDIKQKIKAKREGFKND